MVENKYFCSSSVLKLLVIFGMLVLRCVWLCEGIYVCVLSAPHSCIVLHVVACRADECLEGDGSVGMF